MYAVRVGVKSLYYTSQEKLHILCDIKLMHANNPMSATLYIGDKIHECQLIISLKIQETKLKSDSP